VPPVLLLADIWLFLLGLCIGSFLNVVIARLPSGESLVWPGSHCPKCQAAIRWFDNVPLLSWVLLRGKCRSCKAPISLRYPAVELLTGLLYLGAVMRMGWDWSLLPALLLVTLLVPLALIDLEHWILPLELTVPGVVLGVLSAIPLGGARVVDAALGGVLGFFVFWGMEWLGEKIFKQEALGGGDKYLLAMLGAFLGYRSLLGIIFLASFQGAIVGLTMRALTGRAGPAPKPTATTEPGATTPPAAPSAAEVPAPAPEVPAATPAEPPAPESMEEEDDWVPGPSNIPFGPWLAVAGAELLFFGPALTSSLPSFLAPYFSGG
jgi:leader peptidase (prepilin peptidase)/N-methyltransferase